MGGLDRTRPRPEKGTLDAPQETKPRPTHQQLAPLEGLASRLHEDDRYLVKLDPTLGGLSVKLAIQPGTCDLISVRANPDDGFRMWFYTAWQDAIAPADDLDAAHHKIGTYLVVRL